MAQFWKVVNKVIKESDVLLLLLDARLVSDTRNIEVEKKISSEGKPLIYVVTKSDLVEKSKAERYKKELKPLVFVSAVKHHGTTILRDRILIEAKRTRRRPNLSLSDPPSSAPATPAASNTVSETPASQRLAPCSVIKIGK